MPSGEGQLLLRFQLACLLHMLLCMQLFKGFERAALQRTSRS